MDFTADDRGATLQSEHIPHMDVILSLDLNDVSYLNHWVILWGRKLACLRGTLDIKAQDPEWSDFGVLSLTR